MRMIREALRLKLECRIESSRAIARALGCGRSAITEYLNAAERAGITRWDQVSELDEPQLEKLVCPNRVPTTDPIANPGRFKTLQKPLPDWRQIHDELRNPDVTLILLWTEYRAQHPNGYGLTQFWSYYGQWKSKLALVMRQNHRPGEKAFVDFCNGLSITDERTGEKRPTQLFVGCLGASCYTFALAVESQDISDWTYCNRRLFEFLGGVTSILVPDNLKSAIQTPCRYEPKINPAFREMSEHYGTCVIPARVRKPRDKAKAENAVLQAQRWILAVLRHRIFFSLREINEAIAECLARLNAKVMRGYGKSRRELFEAIDKPALKPLPSTPYEWADWKKVRLGIDYHVRYDDHFYSAPYGLAKEDLWLRASDLTIELFFRGNRVASHGRSCIRFGKTTLAEHMPSHHRAHAEWTPERITSWVGTVGPEAQAVAKEMMNQAKHPELAFNQARGIISLATTFGKERVEKACKKALSIGSPTYRTLKTMLKNKMEEVPVTIGSPRNENPSSPSTAVMVEEQLQLLSLVNIRGGSHYH